MKTQKDLLPKSKYNGCGMEKYEKIEPMSRVQIKGYLEEFGGWLPLWARMCAWSPYSIRRYYTSRLEPEILDHQPERVNISWNPFKREWVTEKIVLIGKIGSSPIIGDSYRGEMVVYPKTIGEAISEYPNPKEITHIFSYWRHTNAAIIYKSPQGISVPEWIEELIAREKAKIHAEVEAIDDELEHPRPPECPPNRIFYDGLFGTKEIKENE
ncbi:MAG: hypothetical protein WCT48_06605 [Candidatus Paceibacterota bacterium]